MERRQLGTIIGVAMVGMGLVQTFLFAVRSERIPTGLGVFFSILGIVYLWAEEVTEQGYIEFVRDYLENQTASDIIS